MQRTKHLIIGAGISGLSFANWLDDDDVLVCEAQSEIGGYCKTIKRDGFVWDFSGHFFHFRHPDIEAYLRDRMPGQRVRTIVKDSRIHHQGALIDFPFQKNIHQLPKDEMIACLVDLWNKEDRAPTSFRDMLEVKFGRAIAEKFLIPYNEKLYATDLESLDVDAMGRFFPHADIGQIIGNMRQSDNQSYNSSFTYPEGGAIQYVHALTRDIDPARIKLNAAITGLDLKRKVAALADGNEIGWDYVVSSAPFPRLLDMAGLAYDAGVFTANKVLVFNLGFDAKGPESIHWMYFADRDVSFYRIGFYDNIFDTDRMSLYVELGYPDGAVIDAAEVARARSRVLADLAAVGVVDGHQVVAEHSVVLDPAYVHITTQSNAEVARYKRALGLAGVHSIGRYGLWTYCSIEDNILEARSLAESFNALNR